MALMNNVQPSTINHEAEVQEQAEGSAAPKHHGPCCSAVCDPLQNAEEALRNGKGLVTAALPRLVKPLRAPAAHLNSLNQAAFQLQQDHQPRLPGVWVPGWCILCVGAAVRQTQVGGAAGLSSYFAAAIHLPCL